MKIVYRYVGGGEFYNGIPARDLTEEDVAALDADARRVVAESGHLYAPVGAKEAPPADPPQDPLADDKGGKKK